MDGRHFFGVFLVRATNLDTGISYTVYVPTHNHSPVNTEWGTNRVLDYSCGCFVPEFSGIQSWYEEMTEQDWINNATERIVMHGKVKGVTTEI